MDLPILNSTEKYRIILRQPGFNKKTEFIKRNFTGGSFPKIAASNQCICCNQNTKDFKNINPVLNDQKLVEPFKLPVCNNCEHHAILDTQKTLIAGILMVVGILVVLISIILFFTSDMSINRILALFFISCLVVFLGYKIWKKHMTQFAENIHGHSPGTSFVVRYHGEIIIETANKQFAHEIISNQKNMLFKVEKNSNKLRT